MNLEDVSLNRKRSKKREFNEYGKVTQLVKKYKETNSEHDLIVVLKALEGIINTYTIILSPGISSQPLAFINPYMKKFLGMFLTPDEYQNCTNATYLQAMDRVRWTMRKFSYEDIYSQVIIILTQTIQSMKVIGDCDCIYYIQLIARYKMHDYVKKIGNDASSNAREILKSGSFNDFEEETLEEALDRLTFSQDSLSYEDELIYSMIADIDISVLNRNDDLFKCLSSYEKFILYLRDYLELTNRQILSVLKHETEEGLNERIEDIIFKLKLIASEGE